MKRLAVPIVLAAVASSAGAAVSPAALVATRSGSSIQITAPLTGPAVSASARTITTVGNAARVIDLIPIQGPAGNLPATVTRTVSASAVAAGLARVAVKAVPGIALASAALDLLKGAGVRIGPNGVELDNGVESTLVDDLSYQVSHGPIASSMSQACSSYAQGFSNVTSGYRNGKLVWEPYGIDSAVTPQGSGYLCAVYLIDPFTGAINRHRNEPVVTYKTQKQSCGTGISRLDGLCETGVYYPATESQVLSALERLSQKVDTAVSLRALIGAGGYADSSPISITGPASQTGDSHTTNTTGPSGTVSTTVTPTYNYTYNGDTITYNTTNNTITTKTNTDGETTTETKTETEPPDTKGLCDLFPSALACIKVGDVPEPDKLPENVKLVAPGRHSAWSYNSGQCPNRTIDFSFGVSVNILQPFCDFFVILKGVILSIFSLASALVFRGGIR